MEIVLLILTDPDEIDRLVRNFEPGKPVENEKGERIGSLVKVWRDGDKLMGRAEVVTEDIVTLLQIKVPYV